jgi:small-conductance mechanosensitive channel
MTDLPATVAAAAGDPLVLAVILFALVGIVTHYLFRHRPLGRAVVRVIFLVALTIALLRAGVVPYHKLEPTGAPLRDVAHGVLKITWWLWAAWFLVGFLRAFVITEHRPREAKLVQDLLAGVVYLAAAFAIISYVFDLPVQGLIATSGAIAIILGLALQSTLSDVFSGIVLNFSRPYRPGDWISLDGGTDGRVIEMNWRATHVLTGKRDLAVVPNSTIAKSKIVNASSPSGIHGMTVTVQLDAATAPSAGVEIVGHAVLNCLPILAAPAPSVVVKSISAAGIEIDATVFVEELSVAGRAQSELLDLIYRHLAAAGIGLAAPPGQPYRPIEGREPSAGKTAAERLVELVAILSILTESERKTIAEKLQARSYDQGEVLLEPGQVPDRFSVVGGGVLSLTEESPDGEIELMRLGPGDHFGEVGLMTGAAADLKITALLPATVYEVARADLAPLLEARPAIAQELCRSLAKRQAAGRLIASAEIDKTVPANRVTSWFAERIHRLFDRAMVD